mmetsp:Transcript_1150/g.2563  ORF Transcript_1150/g.2563 Transcript_1150/m.2563 type:complete len:202 (-) Transcript_1150:390-995(-)
MPPAPCPTPPPSPPTSPPHSPRRNLPPSLLVSPPANLPGNLLVSPLASPPATPPPRPPSWRSPTTRTGSTSADTAPTACARTDAVGTDSAAPAASAVPASQTSTERRRGRAWTAPCAPAPRAMRGLASCWCGTTTRTPGPSAPIEESATGTRASASAGGPSRAWLASATGASTTVTDAASVCRSECWQSAQATTTPSPGTP